MAILFWLASGFVIYADGIACQIEHRIDPLLIMDWYYSKNDVQMGPVPLADLQQKIAHGEVLSSDMAWREGMADWKPVSALPDAEAVEAFEPQMEPH